jgi:outer membrane receptor protein involved in Fe transport
MRPVLVPKSGMSGISTLKNNRRVEEKVRTEAVLRYVNRAIVVVSLLLLSALLAQTALAQTATGGITGTVVDPTGLPIIDVSVVVRNVDTNTESAYATNSVGVYAASYLAPGNYEVTAKKTGFETVLNKGVVVHIGDRLTLNIKMPIQVEHASVTVTEEAPLLETEKTSAAQTVSENLVGGLPIAARRWENFVLLTPAVTTDGNSGLNSFRGLSSLYNGNSVDGANNSQAFFSEARGRAIIVSYVYSADSIKEFQVANSNYSAELGQAAGGVVNAVTRSGTNQWHGDLFYNLRYPDLNALDPLSKSRGVRTQTVHQQNQFGGSVGGPIIKDKLFFFGTYDGFRKVNPILYTSTNSSAIPDFLCPTVVTDSQCSNAKSFITTELLGAFARNLKQDVFLGKLDYQLNSANHVSAVFNFQNWSEPYGYNTAPTVSNGGATQNGPGGTHERFFIANWTTNISNNKVNEVRFQWGRDFEFAGTNSPGPSAFLLNIASYGETSALPRPAFPDEHRIQISDNFSMVKGRHLLKMGVDVNFIHELLINLFQGDGNYNYTNSAAFDQCPQGANATFCRWILDAVGGDIGDTNAFGESLKGKHWSSFTQVNDPITHTGKDDFYNNDFGAYLEDTWKLRSNLTLNLGVRYDLQHVPAPPKPNTDSPLLTLYTSTLNVDKNNFAPRLGVAWQFLGNTMLRAGYGIFYGKTSNSTYYALRVENGVFQQTFSGCSPTSTNPALRACAPTFPDVFFTPPGPPVAAPFDGALTPTVGIPGGTLPANAAAAHGMTPNFVNPVAHEAEVALERQLPGRMTVSATYLLTRGLHLPASYDANVAPATYTRTYDVLDSSGTTVLTPTLPWYTARLDTGTGLILNQYSVINSWYNGLVLTLRKPMSHGLELTFNYTFSKALDNGQTAGTNGTFFGTDGVLDPYNLKQDYSYSDLDQRHRFVGSVVWQPTFGRDMQNKFVRQLVNGWSASAIVTSATGQPYNANIGTSVLTPPAGVPSGIDGGLTGAEVSTFASPTGGRVSWLARNFYNLPNYTTVDFRMGRGFTFADRFRLNFMVDAFNLFNSTIVGGANTTAYTYLSPGSGACTGHTNGCLTPSSTFRSWTTTSGSLYGARQLQVGARFDF